MPLGRNVMAGFGEVSKYVGEVVPAPAIRCLNAEDVANWKVVPATQRIGTVPNRIPIR